MLEATHYDSVLEEMEEPATPCPVCTGDMDAEPCGEDCDLAMAEKARRVRITGLYVACSRALEWARMYAKQGTTFGDARILAILDEVNNYRRQIARLRSLSEGSVSTVDIGYGHMAELKRIRGQWVSQRTYWKEQEGK